MRSKIVRVNVMNSRDDKGEPCGTPVSTGLKGPRSSLTGDNRCWPIRKEGLEWILLFGLGLVVPQERQWGCLFRRCQKRLWWLGTKRSSLDGVDDIDEGIYWLSGKWYPFSRNLWSHFCNFFFPVPCLWQTRVLWACMPLGKSSLACFS